MLKLVDGVLGQRRFIMTIGLMITRSGPAVRLEDAINILSAMKMNIVPSLFDLETIVAFADALVNGGSMLVNSSNEVNGILAMMCANGEIIHLMTNKNESTIDLATVEIRLMCSGVKVKLVDHDIHNHPFPKCTSLRMTLKCTEYRNHVLVRVNVLAVPLAIPGAIGVINAEIARNSRRWSILIGITAVTKGNDQSL